MHGLKWTRKTTQKIAEVLRSLGIRISAKTVGRLLRKMGFSLRVNQKTLESGNKNPPPRRVRNRQFQYISEKRDEFASRESPIVSIDTKKKELVGNFKNQGVSWEQKPHLVKDHDFRSDAEGMAIPYKWSLARETHRRRLWVRHLCGQVEILSASSSDALRRTSLLLAIAILCQMRRSSAPRWITCERRRQAHKIPLKRRMPSRISSFCMRE